MLGTLTLLMEATVLNCSSCSHPINPRRVYKCVYIHLICHCSICKITSCHKYEYPSGGFTHEPAMDAVLSAARVEYAHKGCRSLRPYYELHEHEITCRYAPALALRPAETSPPALIAHLAVVHSIQVHKIQYDTNKAFQELVALASEASRWLILVGEQDGDVFILTIYTLDTTVPSLEKKMKTEARGQEFTVSLMSVVWVRPVMSNSPVYRVRMWAECPLVLSWSHGRRMTDTVTVDLEASSSTKMGYVAIEELMSYLPTSRITCSVLLWQRSCVCSFTSTFIGYVTYC